MSDQIKLEDCPEILKDAVKAELAKYSGYPGNIEVISCTVHKSEHDENTTYKAYLLSFNTVTILTHIDTPPGKFKFGIMEDMVTFGEIKEILRAAPQYF
jgi:hypothetical protein